jgi:hypothetical protein
MEKATIEVLSAMEKEYEYCQTKEYFEQEAESNEYEYFINGREY